MINNIIDNKNIDYLFKKDSIKFDTRKNLNRADNKRIDNDFLDKLNNEGLTSELLSTFNLPIFKYRGQITLHGNFNDITNNIRIGGYKNLILNQNGSLGVKYNAIDYDKKSKLGSMLKYFDWHYFRNSTTEYYVKSLIPVNEDSQLNKKQGIEIYNNLNIDKFYCSKDLIYNPLTGFVYVVIYIKALFESEIENLFTIITGKTINELNEAIETKKQKDEQTRLFYEEQRKIEQEQRNNVLNNNDLNKQIEHLAIWDRTFKNDLHIVGIKLDYSNNPIFVHYKLNKRGAWYVAKCYKESNKLDKFDFDSYLCRDNDKRTGKTPEQVVNRIRDCKEFRIY